MNSIPSYKYKGADEGPYTRYVILAVYEDQILLARTDTLIITTEDRMDENFEAAEDIEW